jgi:DNA-binding NarL/FixJ family response regulator
MQSVSIIVADDHPIVLSGLIMLVKSDKAFKLVATCTNGAEALNAIRDLKPAIGLLDLNMPVLNGLQVLETVVKERIPTRIALIAASPSDQEVVRANAGGAYGIILKESASDALIACLRAIGAGQKSMPADLVDGAIERTRMDQAEISRISELLTNREVEVILRVVGGLSNKEVGRQLNISEGTVKLHLHSVYNKIGVSNRTSLINFAMKYRDHLRPTMRVLPQANS